MKKILTLIFVTISLIVANARTFKIKVLNTPTINIGGKTLQVGNIFDEKAHIDWSSDKQAMKVLSDDNKVYVISKGLLAKYKSKSFADYIISVKSATVRNDGENFPVTVEDHRAILERNFVVLDSLSFKVGWTTNESSYFEASVNNSGTDGYSFTIPSADNVLTISRDLFNSIPTGCEDVSLTITYIEKEYNDTTLITDSMNIEIVPLVE